MLLRFCVFFNLIGMSFFLNAAQENSIRNEAEWRLRDKASQQALDQKIQSISPPIQLPQVDDLSNLSQEDICFLINIIQIEGLLSDWAKSEGEKYLHSCLGIDNIQAYVRLINQKLLSEGYITSRAFLPEQNLASQRLGKMRISPSHEIIHF